MMHGNSCIQLDLTL